jgi:hypothetical protein
MAVSGQGAASGAASGAAIGTYISPGWGTLIGGIIGGIGGAFMGGGGKKPPPPPGYISYDSNGEISGSMTWNGSSYVYKPGAQSPADYTYYEKIKDLRTKTLKNLDKTPEDRLAAYANYSKTLSEALHYDVDLRYEKAQQATREDMAARGLFGARAYADTMGELATAKSRADVEIAQAAEIGKENLAQQDKSNWLSEFGYYDTSLANKQNYDLNREASVRAGVGMSASVQNQLFNQDMTASKYNQARQDQYSKSMMDTAGGIAYLYGFKKPGPDTTPSPSVANYFKENANRFSIGPPKTSYFGG